MIDYTNNLDRINDGMLHGFLSDGLIRLLRHYICKYYRAVILYGLR